MRKANISNNRRSKPLARQGLGSNNKQLRTQYVTVRDLSVKPPLDQNYGCRG